MSNNPPPTPWIGLPRFQDESLLIDAQPIFDDTMYGDDWMDNTIQTIKPSSEKKDIVDLSLDLGDYLPEDEEESDIAVDVDKDMVEERVEKESQPKLQQETRPQPQLTEKISIAKQSHKREISQSLIPIAGPSKKTKPPIHTEEKNDDFYSRRLSSSTQLKRSSSSHLQDLRSSQSHIPRLVHESTLTFSELPILQTNRPTAVTAIPSQKETAASRLKAGLVRGRNPEVRVVGERGVDGILGEQDHVQKHKSSSRIPQAADKTSALSRYLSKSNILESSCQPSAESTAQNPEELDITTQPIHASSSTTIPTTSDPITITQNDDYFTSHRQNSPFSISSSISEASISSSRTNTSIPKKIDDVNQLSSSTGSRRSSMSEKVVGFFSNLLTRSISSSSLREEYRKGEDSESINGDMTIRMDQQDDNNEDVENHEEIESNSPIDLTEEVSDDEHEKARRSTSTQTNNPLRHKVSIVPLTKPIPFSRPLHKRVERKPVDPKTTSIDKQVISTKPINKPIRPLQPSLSQNTNNSSSSSSSRYPLSLKSNDQLRQTMTKKPSLPIMKSKTSAFASAALAKLPAPGKGHSTCNSNQPIIVKPIERAQDLGNRRNVFERLSENSNSISNSTSTSKELHQPKPSKFDQGTNSKSTLNLTVPIRGHTPGKASTIRSIQRAKFDQIVNEKNKEKEKLEEIKRKEKEQIEEKEYQKKRKETVIWAKPVPEMYRR